MNDQGNKISPLTPKVSSSPDLQHLLGQIKRLHEKIRDTVVETCDGSGIENLAVVASDGDGDTIFAIDRISEEMLIDLFEKEIASKVPIVLIGEGLATGEVVLPRGCPQREAVWRIIVDPIDGQRGLMYQKRSGWILTGVAPNHGSQTSLADIELAIQTEIPLVKQHLSDCVWAFRGNGIVAERWNRISKERTAVILKPSKAASIEHGYAGGVRFFPGARDELAAIDEEIVTGALGPSPYGKALCFEDQYASTGGQLYELMSGHDRFIADLRPLMKELLHKRGLSLGICCHP